MHKYYDIGGLDLSKNIKASASNLAQDINEAGNNIVLDLKLNNADFDTYAKIFQEKTRVAADGSASEPVQAGLTGAASSKFGSVDNLALHPGFTNEEIAESQHLIEIIEDAELERRYLHDTASKLAKIKINAIRLVDAASRSGSSDSSRLLAAAVKEFDAIIDIHSNALKEAKREAFRARLQAFRSSLQVIGKSLAAVGEELSEVFHARMQNFKSGAQEVGNCVHEVKESLQAVGESVSAVGKSMAKLGACIYTAIPFLNSAGLIWRTPIFNRQKHQKDVVDSQKHGKPTPSR